MVPFLPLGPWTPPSDDDGDFKLPNFSALSFAGSDRIKERQANEDDDERKGLGLSLWDRGGKNLEGPKSAQHRESRSPVSPLWQSSSKQNRMINTI